MRVREVETPRELRAFVDLPYRLHARDPRWVAPLRFDVRARLSRARNPFFDHGAAAYFLAERGGAVVGRIAAIANRLHDATHGDGVAFFGFFDCVDDPAAARALLGAAGEWSGARGYRTLRGPASFSINDECGLLIDGFDTPPTVMMPHNPPYYVRLVEGAGLLKAKDLWAFAGGHAERPVAPPARATRAVERLGARQGIALRPLDRRRFGAEVERVRECYNAMWERNWGFVPMTEREIGHAARQFRPFLIPDLVPFAERDGRLLGFGLALPDLNEVLKHHRSGRLFPALPAVFWSLWRRKFRRARVLLLGVRSDERGRGIDALLWHWIWTRAAAHGIGWGEASWILEDNPEMGNAAARMGFRRYKTYRMYERPT